MNPQELSKKLKDARLDTMTVSRSQDKKSEVSDVKWFKVELLTSLEILENTNWSLTKLDYGTLC